MEQWRSGVERVRKLAEATCFVDAASVVCESARCVGLAGAIVVLHTASGPPGLAVDSLCAVPDDRRLASLSPQNWHENALFEVLRKRPGVFTLTKAEHQLFVVPLIGPRGWFGTTVFVSPRPLAIELERELSMLVTQLSVWCTDRGIGVLPELPGLRLAPRQFQIAQLAATGRTNGEIADALGISVNTVKVRLKQVFDRLAVNNRIELANVLRRLAPLDGLADGITRAASVRVTRPPPATSASAGTAADGRRGEPRRRRR